MADEEEEQEEEEEEDDDDDDEGRALAACSLLWTETGRPEIEPFLAMRLPTRRFSRHFCAAASNDQAMHSMSDSHLTQQRSDDVLLRRVLKVCAPYSTFISMIQLCVGSDGGGVASAPHLRSENARPGVTRCHAMIPLEMDRAKLLISPVHSSMTFPPSRVTTPAWIAAGQIDECTQYGLEPYTLPSNMPRHPGGQ